MRKLAALMLALAPMAAAADEIRMVPGYTGSADDLVVVRAQSGQCVADARSARVVRSYSNGVLSFSLPPDPSGVGCAAVMRPIEVAYTLRELGLTEFPAALTVRFATASLEQRFSKQTPPTGTPRLAAGWWKTAQGTLTWHQSDSQIGVLVAGQADDGRATWRVGGGPVGNARGVFGIYEANKGTSLRGEYLGPQGVSADGTFEYVVEGPALAWVRFSGTDVWAPARPYYFGEEIKQRAGYFSQYNGVLLSGSWRIAADDTRVQIEQMPTDPIEGSQPYVVTVGTQRGLLRCDADSCQFDASLPAPLGGIDIPNAGITEDRMSQATDLGWRTLLIRDK